ncbi:hypothetical protein J7I98_08140 [Streptomyces sp. ISL-98]|uniref:hypothetical protein n=1 Tax=Streptomyces sp. ISL-98 TaxID=2819192 RepID=UPI001BECE297|nr:hypothetical protein [Streptomyces sp. ISL-98]MBT2505870.1 hypothetical protein [Streptomyces sp. ISL-98]
MDRQDAERGIGEVPHIAAVAQLARLTAPRTPRWSTRPRTGADQNDSIGNIDRHNQHIR